MTINEGRKNDPDGMDWDRKMIVLKNPKRYHLDAVKNQIKAKPNAIVPDDLIQYSHGACWNRKEYTEAMICYIIYFNCSFTMADYGVMIGHQTPHHNIKIGMGILLSKRVMVQSKNNTQ